VQLFCFYKAVKHFCYTLQVACKQFPHKFRSIESAGSSVAHTLNMGLISVYILQTMQKTLQPCRSTGSVSGSTTVISTVSGTSFVTTVSEFSSTILRVFCSPATPSMSITLHDRVPLDIAWLYVVGWLLVGQSRGCIVAKRLDAWYRGCDVVLDGVRNPQE